MQPRAREATVLLLRISLLSEVQGEHPEPESLRRGPRDHFLKTLASEHPLARNVSPVDMPQDDDGLARGFTLSHVVKSVIEHLVRNLATLMTVPRSNPKHQETATCLIWCEAQVGMKALGSCVCVCADYP